MQDHVGADIHTAAHGGPHAAAGGCALKVVVACGKSMQKQALAWKCVLWRGANARKDFVACKNCGLQGIQAAATFS